MPRHQQTQISGLILGRLAFYLRTLTELADAGHSLVSSQTLAEILGLTAAQVRKDLSVFGGFGKQGTGYEVIPLCRHLARILNVDAQWPVIVLGAGDLGRALAGNDSLPQRGFEMMAFFDNDPAKIGTAVHGLPVYAVERLARFIQRHDIEVAIIAVPADQAQAVADRLVAAGVRAILNYAPTALNVPATVRVEDVDPVIHLQRMAFHLRPALRTRSRSAVASKVSKTGRRRALLHKQKPASRTAPLPQAAGGELQQAAAK